MIPLEETHVFFDMPWIFMMDFFGLLFWHQPNGYDLWIVCYIIIQSSIQVSRIIFYYGITLQIRLNIIIPLNCADVPLSRLSLKAPKFEPLPPKINK